MRRLLLIVLAFLTVPSLADDLKGPREATISLVRSHTFDKPKYLGKNAQGHDVWRQGFNDYGSATIVPPITDPNGVQHAVAIGCAHLLEGMKDSDRIDAWIFPETEKPILIKDISVVYTDEQSDVAVYDIGPNADLPHVPLGEPGVLELGMQMTTIGCPGSKDPETGRTLHGWRTMRGKIQMLYGHKVAQADGSTITQETPVVEIDAVITNGHSGGGLFRGGKLYGTAQASSREDRLSQFSMPEEVHAAYHAATAKIQQVSQTEVVCLPGGG